MWCVIFGCLALMWKCCVIMQYVVCDVVGTIHRTLLQNSPLYIVSVNQLHYFVSHFLLFSVLYPAFLGLITA